MREIDSALLAKIENRQQTLYENAAPSLRLVFSKGLNTDLFLVYTIQEGETLNIVDVAVRRETATDEPSRMYALVLDGDVASVKSRKLPYDERGSWRDEFTIGSGITDGAIEFDGVWERQASTARFNLVADEYPWVFYVQNGTLYAKYWEEDAIVLSTGVSACSALRGWQSIVYSHIDQGLIIGYTKSGSLYYRNYAYAEGIGKGWEAERAVPGMPSTCTNVSLFRLNDFRMGFLVETSAGEMSYKTTTRDWAGMASPSEYLTAGVSDLSFVVSPILYKTASEDEQITAGLADLWFNVAEPIYPTFDSASNDDNFTIRLQFSHALGNTLAAVATAFTVRDAASAVFAIVSTAQGTDASEVVLTMGNLGGASGDISIVYDRSVLELYSINQGSRFAVESTTVTFTPVLIIPTGYVEENLEASVTDLSFVVTQVTYRAGLDGGENLEASVTDISFEVTKVGDQPL